MYPASSPLDPNEPPFLGALNDLSDPLTQHLVGAWHFQEGAGGTAVDSGLYGNHGTLVGGADRYGGGIRLDGITGYVNVPHSPILMPSDSITVKVCTRNLVIPALYDVILMKTTSAG